MSGKPRSFEFYGLGPPRAPWPKVARGSGTHPTQMSPAAADPVDLTREALRALVVGEGGLVAQPDVEAIKEERWPAIVAWTAEFKAAALRPAEARRN